jgi:cytochrome c biogenesis protein CcmG/thiol:disulfide interchange protein DsbE
MVFKSFVKSRCAPVVFLSLFLLGMAASPPLVGGPAPTFKLEAVDGQIIDMTDLKGQFVVLNFWATWCVPCIKEMPEFQKAHESLNPNVKIIGINLAESKDKIGEFIQTNHLSFPVLLDGYGNVSQEYQVLHLPVTFFITPDGVIREKIFGGGITQKMIEAKINQLS